VAQSAHDPLPRLSCETDQPSTVVYRQSACGLNGHRSRCSNSAAWASMPKATGPRPGRARRYGTHGVWRFLRKRSRRIAANSSTCSWAGMSLVGPPRPERPFHFVHFSSQSNPHYMARHTVKSGITPVWASGSRLGGNTLLRNGAIRSLLTHSLEPLGWICTSLMLSFGVAESQPPIE